MLFYCVFFFSEVNNELLFIRNVLRSGDKRNIEACVSGSLINEW